MTTLKINNQIYRNSVPPGRRNSLLLIYYDYVFLVQALQEKYNRHSIREIAQTSKEQIFNDKPSPWLVCLANETDIENYNNFMNKKTIDRNNHNCYISLNLTSTSTIKTSEDIISAPQDYEIWTHYNTLPHRIERLTAVAQKGETIAATRFIVAGKYVLTYNEKDSSIKLADIMNNENFIRKINYILDYLARLPQDIKNLDEQQKENIETEVFAEITLSSIESSILDTLSLLTDESHKAIKDILEKRVGERFLAQAEKEGIISSASSLQNYLNIRHLLHHQWDTLDNLGRFNDNEALKNKGLRQQFLNSYSELCNKPLKERIKGYNEAVKFYAPLVEMLNPQLFIQKENESDTDFNKRIEKTAASLKNKLIYIQTYKKKKNQLKKLKKQFPNAKIINKTDKSDLDILLKNCQYRHFFSEIYQKIEYKVNLYCLLSGKNYTPNLAWNYIYRHKLIPSQEKNKWDVYKEIRNELSHQYMSAETNQRLTEIFPAFINSAIQLETKIDALLPEVKSKSDGTCVAIHPDGRIAIINFKNQTVSQSSKNNINKHAPTIKSFTEEYNGGISITTTGTEISSCKLNNGIEIDFEKKQIKYTPGVIVYIKGNRRFIKSAFNEKIITDEKFKILKYIINNKEIKIGKNENCRFNQNHQININNHMQISEESWSSPQVGKQYIKYSVEDNIAKLQFSDNTVLWLEEDDIRVFHENIELTYALRRTFAASYVNDQNIIPVNSIQKAR